MLVVANSVFVAIVLDLPEEDHNEGHRWIRWLFLVVFSAEQAFKVYAFSPRIYFSDWGNSADFGGHNLAVAPLSCSHPV